MEKYEDESSLLLIFTMIVVGLFKNITVIVRWFLITYFYTFSILASLQGSEQETGGEVKV